MIFVDGIGEPEGPVLLEDESWVIVEMSSDRGCVTHIDKEGKQKKVIAKTGRPNGLAVDKEGTIWVAESMVPSLLRLTMDGKYEVFLTDANDEEFLFPNDLVFGPDGYLYMTDSGILFDDLVINGELRSDYKEAKYDGRVYKIDTKTKQITKIDSGILFTNGLVFGPDGNLYVDETITGNVYRYQWTDGEVVGPREEFGNVIAPDALPGFTGPDGMKFGLNGHLYVTVYGQGDVTVLGKDGKVSERIKLEGKLPTNCAFGPEGSKKLYVTEVEFGRMEVFDVGVDGFPLYKG
ncbi:MAG: SMP-30/gluconolactonase/LRE family protein [Spirochaetota bacterium]|nr:MAG: SMP-30/gluconolactonase/LRE family protein [Spirochaetota bacterium]